MEELEGLEVLGNAAAVPVIIFLTQLIKKRIGDFKYSSDLLALGLSFVICTGWLFYEMTPQEYYEWASYSGLDLFKWGIDQSIRGFATWLAASKIYDLGHGNKKKEKEAAAQLELQKLEKTELKKELVKLKSDTEEKNEQTEEDPIVSDKLREILEG